ncbi:Salicylate 5-hydroxylase, large oxygenase component [Variovorax sp. PBS-H4]|uniref:aromatic ring-hydroxylating oxygenase subunit alpha n=1 Tax=Variovorax sp. PBS-H4 TaxID=434008 RepID=UPI0013182482|nr:aromatic ring-hydroxylating dioxygenase subunit alpha [Variovorax sp. PBS-H4]VTU37558.1 Salicylate 5-hydroxylase, large oxygenase component [Variovorax sp. PBS-H4]
MSETIQPIQLHLRKPAISKTALPQSRHIQGEIYTSPDVYQKELDEYFFKDWLFMGRVEQFANPGDYEARRILGRPIIIARNKEGVLHAFHNMCRHRGVEVAEGKGNARSFKCPYHGWTYDLNGQLVGAAYMKDTEGFDPSGCKLPEIHLQVWRGNIFISFAQQPTVFEEAVADLERDFAILHTENCRLADITRTTLQCNWKFFHENLMDYYHVGVLHAKTFGARFSWTPENLVLKPNGGLTMHYQSSPSTPDGKSLFGKAPWLDERDNTFACTAFYPPNMTLFGRIDCVKIITAWPVGPDSCEVSIYMLFPEEFFSHDDFEEKVSVYRKYQLAIYEEDRAMIESMQKAMKLPNYEPGQLSVMEKPIHHFLGRYVDRMFGS